MFYYILRRILYTIPVWLGVIFITFVLFHIVSDPESLARAAKGKNANDETIKSWIHKHGYDKPLFVKTEADVKKYPYLKDLPWNETQFFSTFFKFMRFDLGRSEKTDKPIILMLKEKIGPSMMLTIPIFLLSLLLTISLSLFIVLYRGTSLDVAGVFLSVLFMSIPILIYLMGISYLNGNYLKLVPIYGTYSLPIVIGVFSSLGAGIRFYRTVFLDQVAEDYTRTARAKGLSENAVMFKHVLGNSMIPILTSAVMQIPFLITGSLLLETFFGIPGIGDMFYTSVLSLDFSVIKAFVYLGSLLYMLGTVLTDISYTLVDPRVVLR